MRFFFRRARPHREASWTWAAAGNPRRTQPHGKKAIYGRRLAYVATLTSTQGQAFMASIDEQILKTAKEIVVKFIETGRLSPASFSDTFKTVYRTVEKTVKRHAAPEQGKPESSKK
jgi:hypothetical protein